MVEHATSLTRTDDDPVHWRIDASQFLNELNPVIKLTWCHFPRASREALWVHIICLAGKQCDVHSLTHSPTVLSLDSFAQLLTRCTWCDIGECMRFIWQLFLGIYLLLIFANKSRNQFAYHETSTRARLISTFMSYMPSPPQINVGNIVNAFKTSPLPPA